MVYLPPNEEREQGQAEYAGEKRNLLPVYKPGDRYSLFGAIAGIIAGIIIGIWSGNIFLVFAGIIVGGIAGSCGGAAIGALLTRFRRQRNNLKYS